MRSVGRRLGRGARRILHRARAAHPLTLVALVALVAVAVAVAVRAAGPPPATRLPTGALPPRVGVSEGDQVADYVRASRDDLERYRADTAAAPVYALVTLTEYASPTMLPEVLPAGADARAVIAFARVPMPGRQTEIVRLAAQRLPDDVLAAMAETAERKAGEATRYAELAEGERDAMLRSRLRSSADVSRAESVGYAGGCACVFALVVRGGPAWLASLAAHRLVRSVDPAPEVTDVSRAVFVAPLPEQDVVAPLPDDLTSSEGASVAVRSS